MEVEEPLSGGLMMDKYLNGEFIEKGLVGQSTSLPNKDIPDVGKELKYRQFVLLDDLKGSLRRFDNGYGVQLEISPERLDNLKTYEFEIIEE